MFDSLFGSEPSVAKFVIAFVVVIALIALAAWLVRRFGASRLGNGATRGRQPRLAVIDAASVDGRRRLVLIRRDNIEHLLMIGGPSDIVIEPNIVRASTRDTTRDARLATPDSIGRGQTADLGTSWPLQPSVEPAVAAPARHLRATFGEETHWNGNSPLAEAAHDDLSTHHEPAKARTESPAGKPAGLAADVSARLNPPPTPSTEPSFGRHAPSEPPATSAPQAAPPVEPVRRHPPESEFDSRRSDRNLAEMASRLEAALRRPPPPPEGRPPVTDARAVAPKPAAPRPKVPDVKAPGRIAEVRAPEAPMPENKSPEITAPEIKAQETKVQEVKAQQTRDSSTPGTAAPEIRPAAAPSVAPERHAAETGNIPTTKIPTTQAPKPASKSIYDNLEQEMASLLGRPANK
ncbi:MAG TPA: flagellar biosynthetic protein FliO [Pseudolabrys sp.]|nr:flagellar biosynthetic protein FliO [Pseudolabrys sp.]